MKKLLLSVLFAFLRPQVEPGEVEPAPNEPAPEAEPEIEIDAAEPDAPVVGQEEVEAARREAKEAKDRAERAEREAAELRTRHAPPPPTNDEFAKEEAKLADPNVPDLEKWQIRSNRNIRANSAAAQTALAQAEDVRDQTVFSRLANTEPALFKRYSSRVEEELTKMRSKGFNSPRELIYNQLLAQDMRSGKFQKKKASETKEVDRGKTPGMRGARADVSSKPGAQSEREKRRQRLENVQI